MLIFNACLQDICIVRVVLLACILYIWCLPFWSCSSRSAVSTLNVIVTESQKLGISYSDHTQWAILMLNQHWNLNIGKSVGICNNFSMVVWRLHWFIWENVDSTLNQSWKLILSAGSAFHSDHFKVADT